MVTPFAAATHAAPNLEQLGRSCDIYGCPVRDRLGGVGLVPTRTYRLIYGTDPICGEIVQTFNETLRKPAGALARVTLPLPIHHDWDPNSGTSPRYTDAPDKPTYVAQNPLYSSRVFLRWHYLGEFPYKSWRDPLGYTVAAYDEGDGYLARWQVVRLLNGRRYLITITGSATAGDGIPPTNATVWDVPEDELEKHDWTVPASYFPFNPFAEDDRLISWLHTKTFPPSRDDLKKLCRDYANPAAHREPYCIQNSAVSVVNFLEKDSRVYIVIADGRLDLITVLAGSLDDANRTHNICYINSTLTATLLRNLNNPAWIRNTRPR